MRAAVGDLDTGGIGTGLAGRDAAPFGDRLLGVEVDRVDDVPLLDGAPQVAPASVHLHAVRRHEPTRHSRARGGAARRVAVGAAAGEGRGGSSRTAAMQKSSASRQKKELRNEKGRSLRQCRLQSTAGLGHQKAGLIKPSHTTSPAGDWADF